MKTLNIIILLLSLLVPFIGIFANVELIDNINIHDSVYDSITKAHSHILQCNFIASLALYMPENNIPNRAIKPITKHKIIQKDNIKHIIKKNNILQNEHQIKIIQTKNRQYDFPTSFLGLVGVANSKDYIGCKNKFD